jgi:hypothetical protein
MEPQNGNDRVDYFVLVLLRTAAMLCNLVDDLVDALPDDAYPGEDHDSVVVEMIGGTIATALRSIEPGDVACATEVIELASDRVIEHLKLACELSQRIHGGGEAIGHDGC